MAEDNYAVFRDCLSTTMLRSDPSSTGSGPKRRRRAKSSNPRSASASTSAPASVSTPTLEPNPERAAEELSDFIEYLAREIFDSLPEELQDLDHRSWRESPDLQAQYSLPLTVDSLSTLNLSPDIDETLRTYHLTAPDPTLDSPLPATANAFLLPILTPYLTTLTAPPPASAATRTEECELCGRWWIPLSYHHLIPRFVHEKVVKRGWHAREDLQNVAWLCGACHRFVHAFRGHEDLARDFYTVELLLEEEEVQRWVKWVGKLRWKGGLRRAPKH